MTLRLVMLLLKGGADGTDDGVPMVIFFIPSSSFAILFDFAEHDFYEWYALEIKTQQVAGVPFRLQCSCLVGVKEVFGKVFRGAYKEVFLKRSLGRNLGETYTKTYL
jgi:hypothetical protein